MKKEDLIWYLDEYLNIHHFQDLSKNGLQVDNSKNDIKKIWYAVDANSYIFERARKEKVDMLIVHHWMFWWTESVVVWNHYKRLKKIIESDIALYASHLPLDAHPIVWNNFWLMQDFINFYGLKDWTFDYEKIWEYHGQSIGFWLRFEDWILLEDIVSKYTNSIWIEDKLYNFWDKKLVYSVAFISWGWMDACSEISNKWYDLLISWEWAHHQIIEAKELWLSVLLGWHYETEKVWPTLLAKHLKEMFGIEIVYIDEKY